MWSFAHPYTCIVSRAEPDILLAYLRTYIVFPNVAVNVWAHGRCSVNDTQSINSVLVAFCESADDEELIHNAVRRYGVERDRLYEQLSKCRLGKLYIEYTAFASTYFLIVRRYEPVTNITNPPFHFEDTSTWPIYDARDIAVRVVLFESNALIDLLDALCAEHSPFKNARARLVESWRDRRLLGLQTIKTKAWDQTRNHEFPSEAQLMCCCEVSPRGTIELLWTAPHERRRGYGRALVEFVLGGTGVCAPEAACWRGPRDRHVDRILIDAQPFWERLTVTWNVVCGESLCT